MPEQLNGSANSPSRPTATSPPEPPKRIDDLARCVLQRSAAVANARGDLVRRAEADEKLAVSGRRHSAGRVVGIGAGTNNRAVAYASGQLAGHAAGRGRRGEIAVPVAGDRTDRAVPARLVMLYRVVRETAVLHFEGSPQGLPAALGIKIIGLGEGESLSAAEGEGALADQQYVRRTLHDSTSSQDRVLRAADAGHGAGPAVPAIHHGSIHLMRAGGGKHRAASGIEQRLVLQCGDGRRHRVERAAAVGEDIAPGFQRLPQTDMVAIRLGIGHRVATFRRRHGWRERSWRGWHWRLARSLWLRII